MSTAQQMRFVSFGYILVLALPLIGVWAENYVNKRVIRWIFRKPLAVFLLVGIFFANLNLCLLVDRVSLTALFGIEALTISLFTLQNMSGSGDSLKSRVTVASISLFFFANAMICLWYPWH